MIESEIRTDIIETTEIDITVTDRIEEIEIEIGIGIVLTEMTETAITVPTGIAIEIAIDTIATIETAITVLTGIETGIEIAIDIIVVTIKSKQLLIKRKLNTTTLTNNKWLTLLKLLLMLKAYMILNKWCTIPTPHNLPILHINKHTKINNMPINLSSVSNSMLDSKGKGNHKITNLTNSYLLLFFYYYIFHNSALFNVKFFPDFKIF